MISDLKNLLRTPIAASEIAGLIEQYNRSGINDSLSPPATTIEIASTCEAVVCSNMRRSQESAAILGKNRIHHIDPIFREADLPYHHWLRPKLSVFTWFLLFRGLWFLGYSKNGESIVQAKQRAQSGSQLLIQFAQQHGSVLFVGHGVINNLIAKALLNSGWQGPQKPGVQYWDCSVYSKQAL